MLRLTFETVPHWPPLAWVARGDSSPASVSVRHGPRVEAADDWFCEAAWDGPYDRGDFDRTDLVAGSGGRVRGDRVVFVSAGSTVDRLVSFAHGAGRAWISNSLPCLLAAIDADIDPTYPLYGSFFHSIVRGLARYERWLPTSVGPVQLTYFDNLEWRGGVLTVARKPSGERRFSDFASYRDFLEGAITRTIDNAGSASRHHVLRPLGTLSSGYDSTTVSSLAVKAGLEEVLTFPRAFRWSRAAFLGIGRPPAIEEDTGRPAAAALGLRACEIDGDAWRNEALVEVPFLAANAWGEDVHYAGAERELLGRVLLTGYHGDKVWAKGAYDLSAEIVRGDLSGLSLTEARLWMGFLHCPVAFWGARSIAQIHRISNSSEMKPWDIPGSYSRPICRRIAEEAGVPRDAFGIQKRASAGYPLCREFLSPSSTAAYLEWLRQRRGEWLRRRRLPPLASLPLDRAIVGLTALLEHGVDGATAAIAGATGWSRLPHYPAVKRLRTLTHPVHAEPAWLPPVRRYVFPWALSQALSRYEGAGVAGGRGATVREDPL